LSITRSTSLYKANLPDHSKSDLLQLDFRKELMMDLRTTNLCIFILAHKLVLCHYQNRSNNQRCLDSQGNMSESLVICFNQLERMASLVAT